MFGARDHIETWGVAVEDWTVWMVARNHSPQTIRQWRWLLRKLAETHPRRSPWKLTTEDLWRWYGEQSTWTASTRKNARSAARSFYGWAKEADRIKRDPSAELPGVRIRPGIPRPAAETTIESALSGATDKIRLMILLGAKAGLRCAEIASLRWADIGDDLIVRGKGERDRVIPVNVEIGRALAAEWTRRLRGEHGSGFRYPGDGLVWVFPGQGGTHMSPRWVSQELSKALGAGGTAHMLRHRAAMQALEGTGNLAAVQDLLGHASPNTTRVYSKPGKDALRAAVDSL
jgi:integrase